MKNVNISYIWKSNKEKESEDLYCRARWDSQKSFSLVSAILIDGCDISEKRWSVRGPRNKDVWPSFQLYRGLAILGYIPRSYDVSTRLNSNSCLKALSPCYPAVGGTRALVIVWREYLTANVTWVIKHLSKLVNWKLRNHSNVRFQIFQHANKITAVWRQFPAFSVTFSSTCWFIPSHEDSRWMSKLCQVRHLGIPRHEI